MELLITADVQLNKNCTKATHVKFQGIKSEFPSCDKTYGYNTKDKYSWAIPIKKGQKYINVISSGNIEKIYNIKLKGFTNKELNVIYEALTEFENMIDSNNKQNIISDICTKMFNAQQ